MIVKNLATLIVISSLTLSGCSMFGGKTKQIEVVSKPIEIDIMQPNLPRDIDLIEPTWYVVSEAKIANPCVKDAEGKRPRNEDKTCKLGKENDWPEGYTYLDRFLDDMKELNGGKVVFVATSIGDYENMSANMQELRRYIRELGEVIIYYRNVTMPDGTEGVGIAVKKNETTDN